MALTPRRHLFGKQSGDWTGTIDSNGFLKNAPNATLWVFLTETGATRTQDLQSRSGAAITELVTSSTGAVSEFFGPEGEARLWVGQGDSGERTLIVATDFDEDISELDLAIDGIEVTAGIQSVNSVSPVDGNVVLTPGDIDAAAASSVTTLQSFAVAFCVQAGGGYPPRPSSAVYVIWIGTADPGANALDGDIWFQPET